MNINSYSTHFYNLIVSSSVRHLSFLALTLLFEVYGHMANLTAELLSIKKSKFHHWRFGVARTKLSTKASF